MHNFNLEPSDLEKIEQGKLFIDLPVYNDLLGSEYDVVQEMEIEQMTWNTELLQLTEKLAQSKQMLLADVFQLLNEAETGETNKRLDLLGEFFPEFVKIINSKPNPRENILRLVTEICRRSSPEITQKDIAKLPRNFIQKIHDFALREQLGNTAESYNDLLRIKQNFETGFGKARSVIDEVYKITKNTQLSSKNTTIKELIEAYYKSFDDLGKSTDTDL